MGARLASSEVSFKRQSWKAALEVEVREGQRHCNERQQEQCHNRSQPDQLGTSAVLLACLARWRHWRGPDLRQKRLCSGFFAFGLLW